MAKPERYVILPEKTYSKLIEFLDSISWNIGFVDAVRIETHSLADQVEKEKKTRKVSH